MKVKAESYTAELQLGGGSVRVKIDVEDVDLTRVVEEICDLLRPVLQLLREFEKKED